jgi:hypothetical protein
MKRCGEKMIRYVERSIVMNDIECRIHDGEFGLVPDALADFPRDAVKYEVTCVYNIEGFCSAGADISCDFKFERETKGKARVNLERLREYYKKINVIPATREYRDGCY